MRPYNIVRLVLTVLVIATAVFWGIRMTPSNATDRSPWEQVGGDQWVKSVCDHDNRVYVVRNQNYSAVGITVVEGACK